METRDDGATRRDALLLGAGGLLALAPFEAPAFAMTGDMAGRCAFSFRGFIFGNRPNG